MREEHNFAVERDVWEAAVIKNAHHLTVFLPSDPGMSPWLPALTAIVPGVIEGAVGATDARAAVPAAIRGEAVLQLLRRLAPTGMVVVLEDLHWADPDTVALVEYLGDNLASERVLCVMTLRSEPSGASELARRQRGRPGIVHVELRRLDRNDAVGQRIAADPKT